MNVLYRKKIQIGFILFTIHTALNMCRGRVHYYFLSGTSYPNI